MEIRTVDEFIKQKVLPEFQDVVAMLRKVIKECAPKSQEVLTYGIMAWRGKKILAVVSPTKKDITLSFSHGAEFEDSHGLLEGSGTVSKFIKLKDVTDIKKDVLCYYIKQALEFDAKN